MNGIDHYSNVIDENKKGGGDCPFCLSKIAVYLNISFRMQTSTELMSRLIPHGHIDQESGIAQCCTSNSLQIPFSNHIIYHLGGHLELLKTFKELNLLFNNYVTQIPWELKCTEKKKFYNRSSVQPKMAFFCLTRLPKVCILLISYIISIYRHNNNINCFLKYVLIRIEVLHMNVAEKRFQVRIT